MTLKHRIHVLFKLIRDLEENTILTMIRYSLTLSLILNQRTKYMFCGSPEEPQDYQGYYPALPLHTPTTQTVTDVAGLMYPMDAIHNKNRYDPEMEHLDTRLRSSRI